MNKSLLKKQSQRGSSMVEAVIAFPILVLLTFSMINLAMAGFAAMAANNGTRIGSVAQSNQLAYSIAAAQSKIDLTNIGEYQIIASGGGVRGSQIIVAVNWEVPNYIGGLVAMFGQEVSDISGTAQASFRQEGW